MDLTKISLEKVYVSASHVSDSRTLHLLRHGAISSCEDNARRQLVYHISTYMLGLADEAIEIHRKWPADWWQAVKERFFPAWALARWPVRYNRIDVSEKRYKAVCPHLDAPDTNKCVMWLAEQQRRQP